MNIASLRLMSAVGVLVLAVYLAGCVPIPYRPSTTVSQNTPSSEESMEVVVPIGENPWVDSVATSIAKKEPRIVRVDSNAFLTAADPGEHRMLSLRELNPTPPSLADFALLVGAPDNKTLSDIGAAAPFFFMPVIVGYEKAKKVETVPAVLIALGGNREVIPLSIESRYSEVTAGLVYGIMTIPLPESAVRLGLTKEVIRLLAREQPTGPIRLVVLPYLAHQEPAAAP
jgi:hypothetical protein